MLAEAEQAEALVLQAQAEPHGRIRFICPTGMLQPISALISSFLIRYPKVRLQLVATDRAVDLIEERIDLALRVRSSLTSDAALTMRSLGRSTRILVACPQLASTIGSIEQLALSPILATNDAAAIDGLGIAILPDHVCRDAIAAGRLVRVLPSWHGLQGIVHLVFTTRRGLPPAVRALIDHLAETFPPDILTVGA
jgi:DNA-binding transcriptional LysR family regulator